MKHPVVLSVRLYCDKTMQDNDNMPQVRPDGMAIVCTGGKFTAMKGRAGRQLEGDRTGGEIGAYIVSYIFVLAACVRHP